MQIGDAKLKTKHDSTVVNDAAHVFEYRNRTVLFEHAPPSFAIGCAIASLTLRVGLRGHQSAVCLVAELRSMIRFRFSFSRRLG